MPSFSPLIFSPRPFIPSTSFQSKERKPIIVTNRGHYSYAVTAEGIEIHSPNEERSGEPSLQIEQHAEPLAVLPQIEEISEPANSESSSTVPNVEYKVRGAVPLSKSRGQSIAELNLTLSTISDLSDEYTASARSDKSSLDCTAYENTEKYDTIKVIGHDSEGPCTLVRIPKCQQLRVLKSVVYPTLVHSKPIEAKILHDILPQNHENIIQLHAYDFIPQLDLVQYEFEYCSGGDLHGLIDTYRDHSTNFPELFIWKVFLELTSALEFLHRGFNPKTNTRPGIVHRDIKPQNIFLRLSSHTSPAYPDAVIADFGSASLDFATYEPAGTFCWQPPEIPRKTPKGDVWSVGAIIHMMIHLVTPMLDFPDAWEPTDANYDSWDSMAETRQPIMERPPMYSQELIDMMFVALELDHNKRADSGRLLMTLNNVMGKLRPADAHEVSDQPLGAWAFDHLLMSGSSASEDDVESQEKPGEGRQQYYQMMEDLRASVSSDDIGQTY